MSLDTWQESTLSLQVVRTHRMSGVILSLKEERER
jgi:hypothetical protein